MGVESREQHPLRGLVRSSGVYALASVAAPLVGLVLSPFLTHHQGLTVFWPSSARQECNTLSRW
jgi:hypothetical protein